MSATGTQRWQGVRGASPRASFLERLLKRRAPYVIVGLVGLIFHESFALPIYSWSDRVAAWLLLVILLLAIRHHVVHKRASLPVLVLVAANVYIFFGVPQFTQEWLYLLQGPYSPGVAAINTAAWLVVLGECSLFAGYWFALRLTARRGNLFDRLVPAPGPTWKRAVYLYTVPSLGVYTLVAWRPDYISVGVRYLLAAEFSAYLALVLLLFLGYRCRIKRSVKVAWVVAGVMSCAGAIHGMLGEIVLPLFVGFAAAWVWGGAIRARWVLLLVVAVLVLNPVKNRFRDLAWGDKDVSSWGKVERRIGDWATAFRETWWESRHPSTSSNLLQTASRSNDLLFLAQAIDLVPGVIPYNEGHGLSTIVGFWIPRMVWPSKPSGTELVNNRYAIAFGVSDEVGVLTSTAAVSPFTEGYWNFGVMGVIGFLAVYGVLFGLLLGHNGVRGDASAIVCLAYLGPAPLPLQVLTLAIPGAITFAAGSFMAMWGLALVAGLGKEQARTVKKERTNER